MKIAISLLSLLFCHLVTAFKPSDVKDVEKYLSRYYDYDAAAGSFEETIKKLQNMVGIERTGFLTNELLSYVKKPRCGVKDVLKNRKRYFLSKTKWDSGVTYKYYIHVDWLPRTMSESQVRRAISLAVGYWSKVANIGFEESRVTSGCKFSFSFAGPNHKIYYVDNDFKSRIDPFPLDNVPGEVLAHAFPPRFGNVHFDSAETWTEGTPENVNLRLIAAHEFGHAIGLEHSADPAALMVPWSIDYVAENIFTLPNDDTQGIQSIYGARHKRRLTPKLQAAGKVQSKFCQTKNIEAVFKFSDERFYIIADGHLFRLNGTKLDESFQPTKADKHFKNVDSMFYDKRGKRLIIFKGQKVLSVFGKNIHNVQIRQLNITGHGAYLGKSSAAFIREESEDKDLQYFWIIQNHKVISGELWKNKVVFGRRSQKLSNIIEMSNGVKIPTDIDAAFIFGEKDKSRLYFFVGNSYYVGLPGGRKQSKYFVGIQYPKPFKTFLKC